MLILQKRDEFLMADRPVCGEKLRGLYREMIV